MINFDILDKKLLFYDGAEDRSQHFNDLCHCEAVIFENLDKSYEEIMKEIEKSYSTGMPLYEMDENSNPYKIGKSSLSYIKEPPSNIRIHVRYHKDKYDERNGIKKPQKKTEIKRRKRTKKKRGNDPQQLSLF